MSILNKLSEAMQEVEDDTKHSGYYYKISDVLTIMICGMLCNLQNISDIHAWSKSEPEAFRELVKILNISGTIVVADALHCKTKSAEAVIEEGGDYLFVVKDNTPTLKEDIALFVQNESMEKQTKTERNGGRIEKRTAYVSQYIDWLEGKDKWAGLQTIGAIHTEIKKDEKTSSEWHYYISSAKLSADELLKHARLEWAVESMHWLLDVHFAEDKTMVWDMNVQQNLNIMRKIRLSSGIQNTTITKVSNQRYFKA